MTFSPVSSIYATGPVGKKVKASQKLQQYFGKKVNRTIKNLLLI